VDCGEPAGGGGSTQCARKTWAKRIGKKTDQINNKDNQGFRKAKVKRGHLFKGVKNAPQGETEAIKFLSSKRLEQKTKRRRTVGGEKKKKKRGKWLGNGTHGTSGMEKL